MMHFALFGTTFALVPALKIVNAVLDRTNAAVLLLLLNIFCTFTQK